jgi:hypothetical protein
MEGRNKGNGGRDKEVWSRVIGLLVREEAYDVNPLNLYPGGGRVESRLGYNN